MESIPESICLFWNYMDDIAVEDRLNIKANKLLIQASQKQECLKDLHAGYLGEEKTLLRAQEYIYWPSITVHIKDYIKGYNICQSLKPSQQKDPVIQHDVSSGPWQKAGWKSSNMDLVITFWCWTISTTSH